jgi:Glycosyl transferases group 1
VSTVDVLVVSVDSTGGWRISTLELVAALRRAGATVEAVHAGPIPRVRTFALTDFVQARAAREAARRALDDHAPRAIIYCSITAALLWPRPGAIWLDSIAAENRPGRHGVWQRATERRRLRETPLVLAMSAHSLDPLRGPRPATIVLPVPIEPSGPAAGDRDILALAYAGDPEKRRLDHVLASWIRARRPGETLVVTGIERNERIEGVQFTGRLHPDAYRALLRRSRVFIAAPRREDYGIAALEALADGCLLVGTPAPGPYPALHLARDLDPRLIDADLPAAIRAGLDRPPDDYARRALELLTPFRRKYVDRVLSEQVLPRLIRG